MKRFPTLCSLVINLLTLNQTAHWNLQDTLCCVCETGVSGSSKQKGSERVNCEYYMRI